ncbi:MAG: ammonium transporter [Armatimonadota bacterium]
MLTNNTSCIGRSMMRRGTVSLGAVLLTAVAMAQGGTPQIDAGDTSWMLVSTALVLLMTPGLALFYGGMVRRKNVLGTMMQSFMAMAVISIQWVLIGYSLAFGPTLGGAIGALTYIGLRGVGGAPDPAYAATIPALVFMAFQMMFAIITPALIFGGVAERMKFNAFLIFLLLWATLVYDPLAHWVWGVGGWLRGLGALDFAGGLVVHISAGFTALVAALMLGKRRGYPGEPMPPHNLPLTVLGAGLLWFGWFGFNAGSALAANGLAAYAFVNTNTAAAAAVLAWLLVEWWHHGKPTVLGAASGAVAGLVAVTPAAGFVEPWAAILIGLIASAVCYGAVNLRFKLGYDDSLDAFGVHGVGGMMGALLTGVFATKAVNPAGANGLLYGNPQQLLVQVISVAVVAVFCMTASFVLLKAVNAVVGLRMPREAENEGIDLAEHGESGYNLADFPLGHGLSSRVLAHSPKPATGAGIVRPALAMQEHEA